MTRFIPREKLGKKARKALDAQKRTLWQTPPVTKRVESKKLYNRKKVLIETRDGLFENFLFFNCECLHLCPTYCTIPS